MFLRDRISDVSALTAITPATITADTNGIVIDRRDFRSVSFFTTAAAGLDGTNNFNIKVFAGPLQSDGSVPTFADLTEVSFLNTNTVDVLGPQALGANVINSTGTVKTAYIGYEPFVAIQLEEVGTASAIMSASAILDGPQQGPID